MKGQTNYIMINTKTVLIPAVIYARFSSSGQREESITGQIRECQAFADRSGYRIIDIYEDRAKTGTNADRPAFQQMIKDAAHKQFQAVIVWKLDRFSRDKYDAARYKHVLSQYGVKVVSAMEPISSSPEGVIMESLLEGMAQYYSMDLSMKVKRGNRESALEHKTVGMRMLGYRPDATDHFEIDPDTAPIVKRIFTEYVSGRSSKDIIDGLNSDGIRTRTGNAWKKASLAHILKNERYAGTYIFGDYREDNAMPAIISHDTWETAQRIMNAHKKKPAASRTVKYLLTGKIFCGMCGSPMIGESAKSKTGRMYYYYHDTSKGCKMRRMSKDKIEDRVIEFLASLVNDDTFINQLEDAIEQGIVTRTTKDRLASLEDRQDELTAALARAKEEVPVFSRNEVIEVLRHMRGNPSDERYRQKLVDIFLNAVYIFRDDGMLTISVNYQGERGEPMSYDVALDVKSSSLEYRGLPVAAKREHYAVPISDTVCAFAVRL